MSPRAKGKVQINFLVDRAGADLIDFVRARAGLSRSTFVRRAVAWALEEGFRG